MHMTNRQWVAVLVCCMQLLEAAKHPCLLKIFEDGKEIRNNEICEIEYETRECLPFVKSFESSELPDEYPTSFWPVQKPASMNLIGFHSHFYNEDVNKNYSTPGVTIQWESPVLDLDKRDLEGFLIIWEGGNRTGCRLFKTNLFPSKFLSKLTMSYDIAFLVPLTHYVISVYNMPPPKPADRHKERYELSMRFTTSGTHVIGADPGLWTPSVSVKSWNNGIMEVKFTLSPPEFQLTKWEIRLFKKSEGWAKSYKNVEYNGTVFSPTAPEGSIQFTGLNSDHYQVTITPIDPYHKEKNCLCWKHNQNVMRLCEDLCAKIQTDVFYLDGADTPDYEYNYYAQPGYDYDVDIEVTSMTSTTYELADLLPSTIQRTDSALIGGLVGGFVSACLFSLLIIVCLVIKPKPSQNQKLSSGSGSY